MLILFVGCSLPATPDPESVMNEVHELITPLEDNIGYAQPASETLRLKTGDCEDFSILMIYLLFERYGVKADAYSFRITINGEEIGHCIVHYDGVLYDPVFNKVVTMDGWMLKHIVTYDQLWWYGCMK